VISIHKSGKDLALPSSYRHISTLDIIGKLLEKILVTRIVYEVSDRGLMRDDQFEFRSRHSASLQLARPVERITRKFGEKGLTDAVFQDLSKAFDTVWIDGLLYKTTCLNLPSYKVHKSHHTSEVALSKRPSRRPCNLVEACRLGWLRVE